MNLVNKTMDASRALSMHSTSYKYIYLLMLGEHWLLNFSYKETYGTISNVEYMPRDI